MNIGNTLPFVRLTNFLSRKALNLQVKDLLYMHFNVTVSVFYQYLQLWNFNRDGDQYVKFGSWDKI